MKTRPRTCSKRESKTSTWQIDDLLGLLLALRQGYLDSPIDKSVDAMHLPPISSFQVQARYLDAWDGVQSGLPGKPLANGALSLVSMEFFYGVFV